MLSASLMVLLAYLASLSSVTFISGAPQSSSTISGALQSSSTISGATQWSSTISGATQSSSTIPGAPQSSSIPSGICSISVSTMTAVPTMSNGASSKSVPLSTSSSYSSVTKRAFFERSSPCQYNCSSSSNSSNSPTDFLGGPKFGIYSDLTVTGNDTHGIPSINDLQGFNVIYLAFLLYDNNTGINPADQAAVWGAMDIATRQQIKQQYNDAGIKIMVSAFGSTALPTTSGFDPEKVANDMAHWVLTNNLDGIDIDYEDEGKMNMKDCEAEKWLVTFTITLRQLLPREKGYIISHAPVAPWFSTTFSSSGAYRAVDHYVGSLIDYYNIQFYNQNDYTDCSTLIDHAALSAKSSLSEIMNLGISPTKLVIAKPLYSSDASNGWVNMATLPQCVLEAKEKLNWNGGVCFWQFHQASTNSANSNNNNTNTPSPASAIMAVRGNAFPMNLH